MRQQDSDILWNQEEYDELVMIVSRASGAPVIANAICYAAELVHNKVFDVAKREFDAVKKCGFKEVLASYKTVATYPQQRKK